MPISCHFRDCKALLVTSLTHVSGAIASVQTFMYATPALNLTNRQVSELNACWNNVIAYVDCSATTNGSQLALYY